MKKSETCQVEKEEVAIHPEVEVSENVEGRPSHHGERQTMEDEVAEEHVPSLQVGLESSQRQVHKDGVLCENRKGAKSRKRKARGEQVECEYERIRSANILEKEKFLKKMEKQKFLEVLD